MKLDEALETLKKTGAKVIKESVADDVYDDIFEAIYDTSDVQCDSLCNVIRMISESGSYKRALIFKKDLIRMLKGLY